MAFKTRQLEKIIFEICKEDGIECTPYSYNYIFQLKKGDMRTFIIGYKFDNNEAGIDRLCDDKSALSDVMTSLNIPNVEHKYFESFVSPMAEQEGLWCKIKEYFDAQGGKVVCKANNGTGGASVSKCNTLKELEIAVFNLLKSGKYIALCPLIDIVKEYRVILENGEPMLCYYKKQPFVVGDGVSTIGKLLANLKLDENTLVDNLKLNDVLPIGVEKTVAWKHNLGQGSLPVVLDAGQEKTCVCNMAKDIAKKLNLKFASIDIILDGKDNSLKVLEINSGVMMEVFSKQNKNNYNIAKDIYRRAIHRSLQIK